MAALDKRCLQHELRTGARLRWGKHASIVRRIATREPDFRKRGALLYRGSRWL